MSRAGQVAIVTGGAGGIGAALARAFAREGAQVVVTDQELAGAERVAAEIGGIAFRADLSREEDHRALVAHVEQRVGPIDLYCANAGIACAGGFETPDPDWRRIIDVNLMAHVWGARYVVPDMLRRGRGTFVTVASAAGLLTQLGSAPYAVSKHAAVAFAEWLAVSYGDRGLQVACVCPLGVRTAMLGCDDRIGALLAPEAIEPAEVATAVLAGLDRREFLILPHPQVREYLARKTADPDRWIRGMQRLRRDFEAGA